MEEALHSFSTLTEVIQSYKDNHEIGITHILSEKEEKFVSYSELYHKALGVLHHLQKRGVNPGEELVFQIEDNEKFLSIFWGCLLGNIIPIPISVGNNDEHKLKVMKVWDYLKKPHLVTDRKRLEDLQSYLQKYDLENRRQGIVDSAFMVEELLYSDTLGIPHEAKSEDIAFIQFSSGSTGDPKGVVLTHKNLLANIYAMLRASKWTKEDRSLSWMPLTHDLGMIGCHLTPLVHNVPQHMMPTPLFIRRPRLWMHKASEHKATITHSPNFGYKFFLNFFKPEMAEGWDLSCIRLIFNGAEPISAQICSEFIERMSTYGLEKTAMYTVYGMAEASLSITFPRVGEVFQTISVDRENLQIGKRVNSIDPQEKNSMIFVKEGCVIEDCDLRICDDEDHVLEENRLGHIQITGKNVTAGYYNNPEATMKAFTKDGWLRTGDLGFVTEGSLVVTGRSKDIIFVNGLNYYPHDLERVVEELEEVEIGKVAACAVSEDEQEEIIIFIVHRRKLEDFIRLYQKIKVHIQDRMALPVKEVIPVKEIPKTTSGKLQRYKLRDAYLGGSYQDILEQIKGQLCPDVYGEGIDGYTQTEEIITRICKEIYGRLEIEKNSNFYEMGVDSISGMKIVNQINKTLGVNISIADLMKNDSIDQLSAFIDQVFLQEEYSS